MKNHFRNGKNVKVTFWSIMHIFDELWYPSMNLSEIFIHTDWQTYEQKDGRTDRDTDRRTEAGNLNTPSVLGPRGNDVFKRILFNQNLCTLIKILFIHIFFSKTKWQYTNLSPGNDLDQCLITIISIIAWTHADDTALPVPMLTYCQMIPEKLTSVTL